MLDLFIATIDSGARIYDCHYVAVYVVVDIIILLDLMATNVATNAATNVAMLLQYSMLLDLLA